MSPMLRTWLLLLVALIAPAVAGANPIRIKDLVEFDGVRGNDLVGYGLVVGLNGSGDGLRNAPFTEEIMSNILERLGVNVTGEQFRPKNVAAVFVTAELPAFSRAGSQIDVTVSAIGDAKSLLGGTLIMTPLNAADGEIYAVAQGTIIAGGATAEGDGATVTQGVPTAGVIPSGARVEREIDFDLNALGTLRLALRNPDFTTAGRIETAINRDFGRGVARMLDAGTVRLSSPHSAISLQLNQRGAPRQAGTEAADHDPAAALDLAGSTCFVERQRNAGRRRVAVTIDIDQYFFLWKSQIIGGN